MFNVQGSEIIILVILALIVLGPEKLPEAIRKFSQLYGEVKKVSNGFQSELRNVIDEPMRELQATADLVRQNADLRGVLDPSAAAKPSAAGKTDAATKPDAAGEPGDASGAAGGAAPAEKPKGLGPAAHMPPATWNAPPVGAAPDRSLPTPPPTAPAEDPSA